MSDQGFWTCLPGALLLAAVAPTPRAGALLAALTVGVATLIARPARCATTPCATR